jgi:hypothetical protein
MADFEPSDKVGGLTEPELVAFSTHPWNARIATITPDGWPHVTPVWYEFDIDARRFLVVGREHAFWVGHIRDNRYGPNDQWPCGSRRNRSPQLPLGNRSAFRPRAGYHASNLL